MMLSIFDNEPWKWGGTVEHSNLRWWGKYTHLHTQADTEAGNFL